MRCATGGGAAGRQAGGRSCRQIPDAGRAGAVAGALTGAELARLPAQMVSWDQWREAHPDDWVLSRQTGYARSYGANPYYGYDDKASMPLFLPEVIDNRIEWLKQPVVGIDVDGDGLLVATQSRAR